MFIPPMVYGVWGVGLWLWVLLFPMVKVMILHIWARIHYICERVVTIFHICDLGLTVSICPCLPGCDLGLTYVRISHVSLMYPLMVPRLCDLSLTFWSWVVCQGVVTRMA